MDFSKEDLEILCRKFKRASFTPNEFEELNTLFQNDYISFFDKIAKKYIEWNKDYWKVVDDSEYPDVKWFTKGRLDVCYNIYEKFLDTDKKNKAAFIWEGIDGQEKIYTYQTLFSEVSRLAFALKKIGVKRGDRVFLFLPNLPETVVAILACAKIGAVHVVYSYKFSSDALFDRILNCKPKIIITADGSFEEGYYKVKSKIDAIMPKIEKMIDYVIVVKRTNRKIKMNPFKDIWYHELVDSVQYAEAVVDKKLFSESEDNLFLLYTATNQIIPKGMVHTTAGYLLWVFYTTNLIFDFSETDTFWSIFDLPSIISISYGIYGALSSGGTTFIYEGVIDYEDAQKFYEIVQRYKITKIYSHPNTLRNLMNAELKKKVSGDTKSIRLIATSGETPSKILFKWAYEVLGNKVTPIIDIWFQSETGGALVSSIPCLVPPKIESIAKPLPGADVCIVDTIGNPLPNDNMGNLVIRKFHPALIRGLWDDHDTFKNQYWRRYKEKRYFFTGDSAYVDKNNYIFLKGRVDNIINIQGKRLNLLEIEAVILKNKKIEEVAVISYNHPRKGSILSAFCVLTHFISSDWELSDLENEIKEKVNNDVGDWVNLQEIRFTQMLPKSPSGKVLKNLLKEIAIGME